MHVSPTRFRSLAVAAVVAVVGAFGTAMTTPASAADVSDSVVGQISVTNESSPGDTLHQYQKVGVNIQIDSHSNPVHSGDTFQVGFPGEFQASTASFDLMDGGTALAHCQGSTTDNNVICTFNDEAASRQWVRGEIKASAIAVKTTTNNSVIFHVPGEIAVPLPNNGGIDGPQTPDFPTSPYKRGWAWSDSGDPDKVAFTWELNFAVDTGTADYVIDDTVAEPQSLGTEYPEAFLLNYYPAGAWDTNQGDAPWSMILKEGSNTLTYNSQSFQAVLNVDGARHFTLKLPNFGEKGGVFQLQYISTVPASTPSQSLTNVATINENKAQTVDIDYKAQYEGTLYGPGYGGFTLKKVATGSLASMADGDPFLVNATWGGKTTVISVNANGPAVKSVAIPVGTVVTFTEPIVKTAEGYFYTPRFEDAPNVEVTADHAAATITIQDQVTIAISLTNVIESTPETTPETTPPSTTPPATTIPATTTPETTLPETTTPATTIPATVPASTTGGNDHSGLAQTGADVPMWAMVTGALALLAGGLLMARRRTEQE